MRLLSMLLVPLAIADAANASAAASWPHSVQPFFLSALNAALTPSNASYLGSLPVVVINHKQAGTRGKSEEKQLAALSLVKAGDYSPHPLCCSVTRGTLVVLSKLPHSC